MKGDGQFKRFEDGLATVVDHQLELAPEAMVSVIDGVLRIAKLKVPEVKQRFDQLVEVLTTCWTRRFLHMRLSAIRRCNRSALGNRVASSASGREHAIGITE